MRILFICGAGYVSGREIITLVQASGLKQRGHSVSVINSVWSDGDFERRLAEAGLPSDAIPIGFISKTLQWKAIRMTLSQALNLVPAWLGFVRVVRRFRPDIVVHTNFHHVSVLWPFMTGERHVMVVHEIQPPTGFYGRVKRWHARRLARFICVSQATADSLLGFGVAPSKVAVVTNGIPIPAAAAAKRKADGLPVLGIVGQIGPWKGHGDALALVRRLHDRGSPVHLHVFGRGEPHHLAAYQAEQQRLGLETYVHWRGVERDQGRIYDQIDICLVPSRLRDPYPTVALEAAAYGIPVVATRSGGLPEIVQEGITGWLCDIGDIDAMGDAVERLRDPDERRAMGARARDLAERCFNVEAMVGRFERVLLESGSEGSAHA